MTAWPLAGVVMVSVLVLTGCAHSSPPSQLPAIGTKAASGSGSTAMTTSNIYENMTVRHRTTWQQVAVEQLSAGVSSPVGYLTDQPTHPQCTTQTLFNGGSSMTCGPPVLTLQPGGVFVGFSAHFLVPHAPSTYNRMLDGHQAMVASVSLPDSSCPAGTTRAEQMSIFLPSLNTDPAGSGSTLVMTACLAGPDTSQSAQDVDALISSVHFT